MRLALLLLVLGLAACSEQAGDDLEQFRTRWLEAVNRRQHEQLYGMLDAGSKRKIDHQLELLRGLPAAQQRATLDQLGGQRVEHLHELPADRYFALLWAKALQGQRPTLVVEAQGADAAYMELSVEGRTQRLRLLKEAGRWVWVLPEE